MSFHERITHIVAPLADERAARTEATHVVALRAPFVLRRFAEIATILNTQQLPFTGGQILARRNPATGYTSVEYFTYGLQIVFAAEGATARLTWESGGERGEQTVTADTLDLEIDTTLYDAVSAFANSRPHVRSIV